MQSKVSVQLTTGGEWLPAVLTDEHSASSYGLPVVLVDGEPCGTAEVSCLCVSSECEPELTEAAVSAGFNVIGIPHTEGNSDE